MKHEFQVNPVSKFVLNKSYTEKLKENIIAKIVSLPFLFVKNNLLIWNCMCIKHTPMKAKQDICIPASATLG